MRKIILCLFCSFIGCVVFGQNLTIEETISYINKNLVEGAYLSLSSNGILKYSLSTKDYDLNMSTSPFDYGYSATGKGKSWEEYQREIAKKRTEVSFHILDLSKVDLWNPNEQFSAYNPRVTGFKYLEEWATTLKCKNDKVYHIKKGDCFSINKDGQYRESNHYATNLKIRSKDGFKKSSEKIRNAFLYLLDLAKQNENYAKVEDEDPFAANNFNYQKFDIISTQNSGNIKLTNENGVYYINVKIESISKRFILDSGASDVLISKSLENELISKGILKREDYLPDGLYKIADGSIIKCRRLLIPKLTIGSFTLKNVRATVNSSDSMLLGKSVLDKFKSWKINNLTKELEIEK